MGQAIGSHDVLERETGYVFRAWDMLADVDIPDPHSEGGKRRLKKGSMMVIRRIPRIIGPKPFERERLVFRPAERGAYGEQYLRIN